VLKSSIVSFLIKAAEGCAAGEPVLSCFTVVILHPYQVFPFLSVRISCPWSQHSKVQMQMTSKLPVTAPLRLPDYVMEAGNLATRQYSHI
jgi:hypothetical protein